MAEQFLGEIRQFGFDFPPKGWAACAGQLMPIAQNSALFSLLGVTYGGNGTTTFALPDLRGRTPKSPGQGPGLPNYTMGGSAGVESVTLNSSQLPRHTHSVACQPEDGNAGTPANTFPAPTANGYSTSSSGTMNGKMLSLAGGNQPVPTLPPFLATNFCIALVGIFPSRS